jgi:hypothetical protein
LDPESSGIDTIARVCVEGSYDLRIERREVGDPSELSSEDTSRTVRNGMAASRSVRGFGGGPVGFEGPEPRGEDGPPREDGGKRRGVSERKVR